jgi:hypothetical protein
MALSVGAGWMGSSSALPPAEGTPGVPTSVGFGSGGAGVSFSSYSAARTTIEAGGAPRILSVGAGSGGASREVSKSIGPGSGRVYGLGEGSEGAAFGEEGASDGFVGGGGGTREGGGGGGDNDLTDDLTVLTDNDDLERMEFRLGGTGGGVLERIDVLPDFIEVGEAERVGTLSSVDSGGGGDFDRIDVLPDFIELGEAERVGTTFSVDSGGGGDFDRIDVLPDFTEVGEAERVGTASFVDSVGGGEFDRTDAFSKTGVGGNEVLGAGNRGGGKSAAVGEAALVVGKPAAWSSSLLCTTSSASSYKARPWW